MRYTFNDSDGRRLRVRNRPTADSEIVGYIDSGEEFEARRVGGWLIVDDAGYVMAEFCEAAEEDDGIGDAVPESLASADNALYSMSASQLRALAEASGIPIKARATKAELIKAIENA